MSLRPFATAILLASAFVLATSAVADPAYLPPFIDRAPALGDRWVYAAYDFLGNHAGSVTVEVVVLEEGPGATRYLVEDQLELLPEIATAEAQPVHRHEWFRGADGSIWRGDLWVDDTLTVELRKPIRVFQGRRGLGHLGWPKPVKRRGQVSELLVEPSEWPPLRHLELRLGDRSHPTLWVSYDRRTLGRVRWTDRFGLHRTLVSAVIDGVAYEP